MDIYFANHKLKGLFESERELIRKFGPRMGKIMGRRLGELAALPSLAAGVAVPHLSLHQLGADRDEQFALTLVEPKRLILQVAADPVPRLPDGGIDTAAITAVIVLEVIDYH